MFSFNKILLALVLVVNLLNLTFGQQGSSARQNTSTITTSNSDNTTPTGVAKGVNTLGSYGGSNFDTVNLFNGNVSMSFTLATLTGRGGMSAAVVLSYNSKLWRVERQETEKGFGEGEGPDNNLSVTYHPVYDDVDRSIGQLAPGWVIQAGRMRGNQSVEVVKNDFTCVFSGQGIQKPKPKRTLTTFTFTAPNGSEYDFRDVIYDGQPRPLVNCEGVSRGREFISKDGTVATFISDTEVFDSLFGGQISSPNGPNGFVYLRDGTRFRIEDGLVKQQRDNNGNVVRYDYDGARLIQATDNLGRTITVDYNLGGGILAKVIVKGIGGAERITYVKGTKLTNTLAPTQESKNIDQLFPVEEVQLANPNFKFNPKTVSEIILPNGNAEGTQGHKWEFKYNSYGEVVYVKNPSNGVVEFEMGPTPNSSQKGGYIENVHEIFRRVVARKTYPSGIPNVESKTVYSDPREPSNIDASQNLTVLEEAVNPNNNDSRLALTSHKFSGHPTLNLKSQPFAFRPWLEGKELRTELLNFDGSTVMRRVVTDYEQQAGVSWVLGADNTFRNQPENNPRVIRTTSSLLDSTIPKTSKVEYQYDGFNNVTTEILTGYESEIIRQVERTYVTTLAGLNMGNLDTHLRSLIDTETIKDGNGLTETITKYKYDQYTGENNAALVARALTVDTHAQAYQNPQRIQRGNVTSVTRGFGSSAESTIYSHYDVLGNVVEVVGPNTNQKLQTIYTVASQFTFPEQTKQFVEGGLSGSRELTSTREFDFHTGLVTSSTNFNQDKTILEYNDKLDRLTLEIRPDGTNPGGFGRTEYIYSTPGDYPNTLTTKISLDDGGNRKLTSISEVDGFLRTIKRTRTDGNNDSQPKVSSEIFYDALGRTSRVNNPFREGQTDATTYGYIISQYDALSRVFRVQTFDKDNNLTGTANTVYETNLVTLTDQAGKQRKTETDAAKRLTKVYEPNDVNQQLDQTTSYTYDARSNLTQVNQGIQTRTFVYDALSRLTSAKSPESGLDGDTSANGETLYEYDDASNLIRREDPKHLVTTYTYDSINRLATKSYSDTTPPVSYFYDIEPDNDDLPLGVTKPTINNMGFSFQNLLGRTVVIASPGTGREMATALFHSYDKGGRITKSSQFLDERHYVTSSDYNLASLPTGHIYPSGRSVAHSYNIAGQITDVTSNFQPVSQFATYTPSGAILSHSLGNGLSHQMKYNSRLQPTEITLDSSTNGENPTFLWKQEYNYAPYDFVSVNGSTPPTISSNLSQNNGNIGHIRLTPGTGVSPINQFFVYDELNRLKLAKEFTSSTPNECCPQFVASSSSSGDTTINNFTVNNNVSVTANASTTEAAFPNPHPSPVSKTGQATFQIDLTNPQYVGRTVTGQFNASTSGYSETSYFFEFPDIVSTSDDKVVSLGGGNDFVTFGYSPNNFFDPSPLPPGNYSVTAIASLDLTDPQLTAPGVNISDSGFSLGLDIRDYQVLIGGQATVEATVKFAGQTIGTYNVSFERTASGISHNAQSVTPFGQFTSYTSNFNVPINLIPYIGTMQNYEVTFTTSYNDERLQPSSNIRIGDVEAILPGTPINSNVDIKVNNTSILALNESSDGLTDFSTGNTSSTSFDLTPYIGSIVNVTVDQHIDFGNGYTLPIILFTNVAANADFTITCNSTGNCGSIAPNRKAASTNSNVIEPQPLADSASWSQKYTYDRYGNRSQVIGTNAQNLNIATLKNRLSTADGYKYDEAGNLIYNPQATPQPNYYFYDAENRLIKVATDSDGNNIVAQYFYDVNGWRVKKVVTDGTPTRFVYDQGGRLLIEYDNASFPFREHVYAPSGMLATFENNGEGFTTTYHTPDHLGSHRILTDGSGNIISRRDFLPFGEQLSDSVGNRSTIQGYSATDSIRQKFTGYERDEETKMDFAQDRYYSNANARFTTTDSFFLRGDMIADPQRFNLYAYVTNNPMKYTDPDGRILRLAGRTAFLEAEVISVLAGKFRDKVSVDYQTGVVSFNVTKEEVQDDPAALLLFGLVNSTETFIFLSSSVGTDAANLVNTVTKGIGYTEEDIINYIEGDPTQGAGGGYMPSSKGTQIGRAETPQPKGNVFAVIAVNPDSIVTQRNIGSKVDPLSREGVAQLAGIGQQISQVAIYIHEAAENLELTNQKGNKLPLNYNEAHKYAIKVEVDIFKARSLSGGLAGGEPVFVGPRNKKTGQ